MNKTSLKTPSMPGCAENHWTVQAARELYNIAQWSEGYFDINEQGNLIACPNQTNQPSIVLTQLVHEILQQGLRLPILVRFTDILAQRAKRLSESFQQAIQQHHYQGQYTAVYPIKVNQHRRVVEEFSQHKTHRLGLEA